MFDPFKILVLKLESSQETWVSGGTNSLSNEISSLGSSGSEKSVMGMGSVVERVDLGAEKSVEAVGLMGNFGLGKNLKPGGGFLKTK